mmetsp:Transcript_21922/g.38602  ORF Transcript_21922/g.38602 Transcript_21922/m.38602 type:complete len:248 (+) Transcript_21922:66-809(+)
MYNYLFSKLGFLCRTSRAVILRASCLHYLILRTTSAFWHSPVDVFVRHLNATAFAVDTVLRVDYQLLFGVLAPFVVDVFIHSRRTESLFWTSKDLERRVLWNIGQFRLDAQVGWLVIFMVGSTSLQICQQVKRQLAIRSRVFLLFEFVGFTSTIRVSDIVFQCPGFFALGNMSCQTCIYQTTSHSPLGKGLMAISNLVQLVVDPGIFQLLCIGRHFFRNIGLTQFACLYHWLVFLIFFQSLKDSFGG